MVGKRAGRVCGGWRAGLAAAAIVAAAGAIGGCQKPLLAPDEERSQYDRFDAVRNQRAAPYLEDEFGRKRPNLRGRLLAKD
ncbi:MAG: hypothetical protein IT436_10765 [Phycisphaerales bacterium]|nr:hypothetical protein [Phycisphaerales bacterium]